jgi:hypothetical protein
MNGCSQQQAQNSTFESVKQFAVYAFLNCDTDLWLSALSKHISCSLPQTHSDCCTHKNKAIKENFKLAQLIPFATGIAAPKTFLPLLLLLLLLQGGGAAENDHMLEWPCLTTQRAFTWPTEAMRRD